METPAVVEFQGNQYKLLAKGKYYVKLTGDRKWATILHKDVWEHANGMKVPEGYEVHHVDFNHLNNDPGNLVALPRLEHRAIHSERNRNNPEFMQRLNDWCAIIRPMTKEWHGSETGAEWHREHYEEMKHLLHKQYERTCEFC